MAGSNSFSLVRRRYGLSFRCGIGCDVTVKEEWRCRDLYCSVLRSHNLDIIICRLKNTWLAVPSDILQCHFSCP